MLESLPQFKLRLRHGLLRRKSVQLSFDRLDTGYPVQIVKVAGKLIPAEFLPILFELFQSKFGQPDAGGFKPKERAEWPSTFTCTAGNIKVGGRELLYFDAFANQYRVNGQDVLAQMRRNIGQ